MAEGISTFDSDEEKVSRFDSTPLTVAIYDGKLVPGFAIEVAAGDGKLPYLNGRIEILGTGKDGGKNRKLNQRLFLNTTPDADGVKAVNRGDGIVALAKAMGTRLAGITLVPKMKSMDSKKKDAASNGNDAPPPMKPVEILDPAAALRWVESNAGQIFKFQSRNEKSTTDGKLYPKVDFFIEAEPE